MLVVWWMMRRERRPVVTVVQIDQEVLVHPLYPFKDPGAQRVSSTTLVVRPAHKQSSVDDLRRIVQLQGEQLQQVVW